MLETFVSFVSYFFAIHSLVGLNIMKKNILFKNIIWFIAILPLVFSFAQICGVDIDFCEKILHLQRNGFNYSYRIVQ